MNQNNFSINSHQKFISKSQSPSKVKLCCRQPNQQKTKNKKSMREGSHSRNYWLFVLARRSVKWTWTIASFLASWAINYSFAGHILLRILNTSISQTASSPRLIIGHWAPSYCQIFRNSFRLTKMSPIILKRALRKSQNFTSDYTIWQIQHFINFTCKCKYISTENQ